MKLSNKYAWGKQVRIIGLSIDKTVQDARKYVLAKRWRANEQFHAGEGSNALIDFPVKDVPYLILVDKLGKIVYCGGPKGIDIEGKIKELQAN